MILLIISVSLGFSIINGVGFDYPNTLPTPKQLHLDIYSAITGDLTFIGEYETPIAIRYVSIIDQVSWNCIAVYHTHYFDSITEARPIVVVPQSTLDVIPDLTKARMLCIAYAMTIVSVNYMPETLDAARTAILGLGLSDTFLTTDVSDEFINTDVSDCAVTDVSCLLNAATEHSYYPEIMASIIAYQALDYLKKDGWNADGSLDTIQPDGTYTTCTANCRAFSDTTGYTADLTKEYSWKPLVEDNGKGFFYQYNHVTPHIGKEAAEGRVWLKVMKLKCGPTTPGSCLKRKVVADPNSGSLGYGNYNFEKQLVIDNLEDLATNDTKKMLVEFFDNKLQVAHTLLLALDERLQWTLEERVNWLVGYTAIEYDAVLLAWKEKVKWDRIRPTTLIKQDGDTEITTYAGPGDSKAIKSSDFESYIRVMPHSEYPSGSGCLCFATKSFTEHLLEDRYATDFTGTDGVVHAAFPITMSFPAGSSLIEPGVTPANEVSVTVTEPLEYADLCAQSRLWGGMHFRKAVDESIKMCRNLGVQTKNYVKDLLNGEPIKAAASP